MTPEAPGAPKTLAQSRGPAQQTGVECECKCHLRGARQPVPSGGAASGQELSRLLGVLVTQRNRARGVTAMSGWLQTPPCGELEHMCCWAMCLPLHRTFEATLLTSQLLTCMFSRGIWPGSVIGSLSAGCEPLSQGCRS